MTTNGSGPAGAILPDTPPQDGTAPIVELRAAGKAYGNIRALHGVSLAVRPGQVTCVLGDNGAGKSTLIKIISGLHQHTEGEFLVDGTPVRFSTPAKPSTRASPPSTRTSPPSRSCRCGATSSSAPR